MNFVILDVDRREERSLAQEMGAIGQPFYAVIPPGAGPDQATQLRYGPLPETRLRELLDDAIAAYRTE